MSDEQWTVETADTDYYHWVEGLERNVRYAFQVRSGNEQGFGPWSESLTDRTRTRPEPIHNPTVTRGDGSLKVRWPQFADADDIDYIGYYVYWIDATAHSRFLISRWNRSDLIASVDPCSDDSSYDDLEHVISGLSNNVRYKVVVRAQTSWGRHQHTVPSQPGIIGHAGRQRGHADGDCPDAMPAGDLDGNRYPI